MKHLLVAALAALTPCAAQAGAVYRHVHGGCFARTYSAQHLRQHPRQTVRSFSLTESNMTGAEGTTMILLVTFRVAGRPTAYQADAY